MYDFDKGNFKKLGGAVFKKWDLWEEGEYFIGKYSKKEFSEKYKKYTHFFEIMESNVEEFGKGKLVGVSAGSLQYQIDSNDVVKGDILRIEYMGKEVMPKGDWKGKEFTSLDIQVFEPTDDSKDEDEDDL